ncbi:unnamed protein product [Sphagnum jensenii]|uniref:Uncharacterized protein n=1 Tax=Sphagnum jensenii TaxID=128206 RepID=A0ABP0XDH4_9BRYO
MATGMTGRAAAAAAAIYTITGLHQTEACMNGTQHSAPPKFRLCLSSNFLGTTTRPLLSGTIMSNTLRGSRPQSRQSLPVARAAKLPTGMLQLHVAGRATKGRTQTSLFWGFTEDAEVWNSRAAMIGIFGIIAVEAIINEGILQLLGIEVGKGLDLPL